MNCIEADTNLKGVYMGSNFVELQGKLEDLEERLCYLKRRHENLVLELDGKYRSQIDFNTVLINRISILETKCKTPEKIKYVSFKEAYQAFMHGKSIKRYCYYSSYTLRDGDCITFSPNDIEANDWVIVEKDE